jgi:hypothetical protein
MENCVTVADRQDEIILPAPLGEIEDVPIEVLQGEDT